MNPYTIYSNSKYDHKNVKLNFSFESPQTGHYQARQ